MTKSVRIDEETHKKLKIYSATTGSSVTEIIKDAITQYIALSGKPLVVESTYGVIPKDLPKAKLDKAFVKQRGEMRAEDY